jgi:hypothetical protein
MAQSLCSMSEETEHDDNVNQPMTSHLEIVSMCSRPLGVEG